MRQKALNLVVTTQHTLSITLGSVVEVDEETLYMHCWSAPVKRRNLHYIKRSHGTPKYRGRVCTMSIGTLLAKQVLFNSPDWSLCRSSAVADVRRLCLQRVTRELPRDQQ